MRGGAPGPGSWLAVTLAALLSGAPAEAQEPVGVRAAVSPPQAQLGERVTYRGRVLFDNGAGPTTIRWIDPAGDSRFSWGEMAPRYVQGRRDQPLASQPAEAGYDTAFVEVPLQVFDTGVVRVPGVEFEVQRGSEWERHRLPLVNLPIVPMLAAGDTAAALRPLRGPLEAPWWERVPWFIVLAAMVVLLATWFAWRWLRRRRLAPVPTVTPAPARIDPVAEALRELAALRKLRLPQAGRFGDHALHLTRIFKRFLENATGVSRPGDTTPELVERLATSGSGPEPQRVGDVMRRWDAVKFAGARSDLGEAQKSETAVEQWIRQATPRGETPADSEPPAPDRTPDEGSS